MEDETTYRILCAVPAHPRVMILNSKETEQKRREKRPQSRLAETELKGVFAFHIKWET